MVQGPTKFLIETHHLKGLFMFDNGPTVLKLWLLTDVELPPLSRLIIKYYNFGWFAASFSCRNLNSVNAMSDFLKA